MDELRVVQEELACDDLHVMERMLVQLPKKNSRACYSAGDHNTSLLNHKQNHCKSFLDQLLHYYNYFLNYYKSS